MRQTVVLVLGRPAAGKSTLAGALAARCGMPLIAKDDLKEILFDTLGSTGREASRRLGPAVFALLHRVVEYQLASGGSFIVDAAFDARFEDAWWRERQSRLGFRAVRVHCTASDDELLRRYRAREASGARHPGHADAEAVAEYAASLGDGRRTLLALDGPVVDASAGRPLDAVLAEVGRALAGVARTADDPCRASTMAAVPDDAAPETRIDLGGDLDAGPLDTAARAAWAELQGFDGIAASETRHDPFLALALAARETQRVQLQSAVAIAFARSPMTVAQSAFDLQAISGGRFVLGLGSQVQAHVEKRFSMPWSRPAARMAEFVRAVRAIWATWQTGEPLAFRGEFYTHTLMTPFFSPPPLPSGPPPVWLAAVGERMAEVAGSVADGLHAHSFTTPRYLAEVTLPALRRGAAEAGRDAAAVGVAVPPLVAIGEGDELDAAVRATRERIAFYGSTPAYLPVLEAHGWGGLHERLHAASRRGEWTAMGALVSDDVLAEFAAVGSAQEVADRLLGRFGGLATRLSFSSSVPLRDETTVALVRALRGSAPGEP